MGKTADNELKRLRANFYNNVAVGTVISGVILPYFSVVLSRKVGPIVLTDHLMDAFIVVVGVVTAALLRNLANYHARQIED